MRLSAEQFEQILSSLRSEDPRLRQQEKRRSPRVGLRMQATVIPCEAGQAARQITTWVRDLSTDGIGVVSGEPIAVGSHFLAVFRRRTGEALSVLYRVANCRPQTDRLYAIGGKLERIIAQTAANGSAA